MTLSSTGPVVSMVKVFTDKVLLVLLALSLTVMVQLLWVSSASVLKVIVLLSASAEVSELSQLPPYVMTPASFE